MEKVEYETVIRPKRSLLEINLKEIWRYRDLLMLLVRRDFVSVYKQTILGPLWFFLQPVFTTATFTVIFSFVAKIPTDDVPGVLFYLTGITFWNYFSSCLTATSNTFVTNASVFGKVYFPRLIVPLSVVISNLMKLGIQFLLFLSAWIFFLVAGDKISPKPELALFPFYILIIAMLGLAFGLIFSSLTTKYRDLGFLIAFGVQLLMYATPVIYPVSVVDASKQWILFLNPLTSVMEAIKYSFLGKGVFSGPFLLYSTVFTCVTLFAGVVIFNKVEKDFIDTV